MSDSELYLGRQPILDRQQKLVDYELLFRAGHVASANVTDGVIATATVITNAFSELSVGDALGEHRGFINVDEDFLFSDLLELLPRESVVLEILETVPPTERVIQRCAQLKAKGFILALDDVIQLTPEYRPLFDLAEIVKVDLPTLSNAALATLARKLRPLGKKLLAEKVDSREQMEYCLELGFDLFQGYYFAKPTVIAGKRLDHSQVALMKLMGLLLGDAETSELEAVFKTEPGLTMNLLRLTNSVGAGMVVRISSLRHAITVVGRRHLQRWLQLLLYASQGPQGLANPLLQLAATRGRIMELLAGHGPHGDADYADQAFMVGIMSLMPALIGLPIADIIGPLAIAPEVRAALCDGTGSLGALLRLTELSEQGDPAEIAAQLERLPELDAEALNHCVTQALAWASDITREAAS
ncbi:MAG: EAL and HDOD domain-containing protein [Actinomycetota bacterium]